MLVTETLLKVLPKLYILLCVCTVCFTVLMVWINHFIAVSLKSNRVIVMHVLSVHRFPDATGVAFTLTAWARHRCLQLYLYTCKCTISILFGTKLAQFLKVYFKYNSSKL